MDQITPSHIPVSFANFAVTIFCCSRPLPSSPVTVTLELNPTFVSPEASMANAAKYVWLDDELKDAATSGVPIVNAGLHYGYTVFEGIRSYATDRGPAVFRLDEHVDRLLDSALILGFRNLPWTRETLIDAIHKTIAANKFSACYIRPVIYLDGAMDLVVDSGKPRLIIAVWSGLRFSVRKPRSVESAPTSPRSRVCIPTS